MVSSSSHKKVFIFATFFVSRKKRTKRKIIIPTFNWLCWESKGFEMRNPAKSCHPRKFIGGTYGGIAKCDRRFRELLLVRCGLWREMGPNLISIENAKWINSKVLWCLLENSKKKHNNKVIKKVIMKNKSKKQIKKWTFWKDRLNWAQNLVKIINPQKKFKSCKITIKKTRK